MPNPVIYTVGGTVQAGRGIYIKRKADEELLELCRQSEFAFILSSRQVGKSSLIVRTAQQLESENIRSVLIDLSAIGVNVSLDEWYMGILNEISNILTLRTDVLTWWMDHAKLGPAQRLTSFFKDVLLNEVKEQIVLFVDEIDSTLSIPFSDDFYVAVRAVYNARATMADFKRLSFVLVGVATPSDLISGNKRTPFNVGRRVEINDFNLTEAFPLVENFGIQSAQILTWVFHYTSGHPYLTQLLCAHLARLKEGIDEQTVGHAVERLFTGEQGKQDNNLQFVRDMLSVRSPDIKKVLRTYQVIRSGKKVEDDERSVAKAHLKLAGLVRSEKGFLKVRNEIYNTVFNPQWIEENLPKEWQRTAFKYLSIPVGIFLLGALGIYTWNFWNQWLPPIAPITMTSTVRATETPLTFTTIPNTSTATVTATASPTKTNTPAGPLPLIDSHGAPMILVSVGSFQMGAISGDLRSLQEEKPIHEIQLDAYYIDKYEVTNALYKVCADAGVCDLPIRKDPSVRDRIYGNPEYNQHPVVNVNWYMAQTYCEWRGARLPTEAEWEKAARGDVPRLYPWEGTEFSCQFANYNQRCVYGTTQVGVYESGKSPYGLYDMAGNVWEWVSDWYSQDYYGISFLPNPPGPVYGQAKVARGGSWASGDDDIRTSKRLRYPPGYSNFDLGFRCAMSVPK